jgi:hypothetical protein
MRITEINRDLIVIDENSLNDIHENKDSKVHLIKFKFDKPTKEKILNVLDKFPDTNRFIVSDNIKIYNDILKTTSKKYYIQNNRNQNGLISFFRKNNKVLLAIPSLGTKEKEFILNCAFDDVLRNLEIIMIEESDYKRKIDDFKYWKGNCIIFDPEKHAFIL